MNKSALFICLMALTACHTTKETSQKSNSVQDTQMQTTTLTSIVSTDSVLKNATLELDSFDLIVERAILPYDTVALPSPALRYRLRAKHATLRNNALLVSKTNKASLVATDSTAHRNTQRETETAQESTAVYKPPDINISLIITVLLATAAIILFIRYRLWK